MKKLIVFIVALALIVAVVSLFFGKSIVLAFSSPEAKACAHVGELCSSDSSGSKADLDRCSSGFEQMKKLAGAKAVDQSVKCINEADTCAKATGCFVGGIGVGTLKEMVKGVGNAISQ